MKASLLPYVPLAKMLAETFGQDCEVVLHDLDTPEHSVVYVVNNTVTGRAIGDSFDHLVRQVILSSNVQENFVANYYFDAPNGKRVRSSTLLIKDAQGRLEGALCLNLDTTRLAQQLKFLQSLLPQQREQAANQPQASEQYPAVEHMAVMIDKLMDGIIGSDTPQDLTREQRIAKVRFMDAKGLFLMKGSIEKAAAKLGINKVTVYSYLDEIKGKR